MWERGGSDLDSAISSNHIMIFQTFGKVSACSLSVLMFLQLTNYDFFFFCIWWVGNIIMNFFILIAIISTSTLTWQWKACWDSSPWWWASGLIFGQMEGAAERTWLCRMYRWRPFILMQNHHFGICFSKLLWLDNILKLYLYLEV